MYKSLLVVLLLAFSFVAQAGNSWMLMEAPDATDMSVENRSYQINGASSLEDCMEMLSTYYSDDHRWCEPIDARPTPYDLNPEAELYSEVKP